MIALVAFHYGRHFIRALRHPGQYYGWFLADHDRGGRADRDRSADAQATGGQLREWLNILRLPGLPCRGTCDR